MKVASGFSDFFKAFFGDAEARAQLCCEESQSYTNEAIYDKMASWCSCWGIL